MAARNARRGRRYRAGRNKPSVPLAAPVAVTQVDPADPQHIKDAAPAGSRRRGSRADGTNPRARGTNPRAQGTSLRQLGVSPRQIRARQIEELFQGLTPEEAERVTERLNERLIANPKLDLEANQTIEFEEAMLPVRDSALFGARREWAARIYAELRERYVKRFWAKVGHYAEDLVQDAFVHVCEELLRRDAKIVNPEAWLRAKMTKLLIDDKRRVKRRSRQHGDAKHKSSRYGLDDHRELEQLEASE